MGLGIYVAEIATPPADSQVSYWIGYGTNYIGGTEYFPETGTGQSTAAW